MKIAKHAMFIALMIIALMLHFDFEKNSNIKWFSKKHVKVQSSNAYLKIKNLNDTQLNVIDFRPDLTHTNRNYTFFHEKEQYIQTSEIINRIYINLKKDINNLSSISELKTDINVVDTCDVVSLPNEKLPTYESYNIGILGIYDDFKKKYIGHEKIK